MGSCVFGAVSPGVFLERLLGFAGDGAGLGLNFSSISRVHLVVAAVSEGWRLTCEVAGVSGLGGTGSDAEHLNMPTMAGGIMSSPVKGRLSSDGSLGAAL